MCDRCGYSPKHCTCGFGERSIRRTFMEEVRAKGYVAAHSRHISTTKKVYVPAGMVVDPRRGEGWRLS